MKQLKRSEKSSGSKKPGSDYLVFHPLPYMGHKKRDALLSLAKKRAFKKFVRDYEDQVFGKQKKGERVSHEQREAVWTLLNDCLFEMFTRKATDDRTAKRLKNIVLVIKHDTRQPDPGENYTASEQEIIGRIVLPFDVRAERPFIPIPLNDHAKVILPINSMTKSQRERVMKGYDPLAIALGNLFVKHRDRDEYLRAAEKVVEAAVPPAVTAHPNRTASQTRTAVRVVQATRLGKLLAPRRRRASSSPRTRQAASWVPPRSG